jgi:hypothetical protein
MPASCLTPWRQAVSRGPLPFADEKKGRKWEASQSAATFRLAYAHNL